MDLAQMKAAVTMEGVLSGAAVLELIAEVERLTALCDGYKGEVEMLTALADTQEVVCNECHDIACEKVQSALTRARAEGMEEAAVIAETISMPSFGSDAKWDGYEMATEDIASAIRLAKDKL